MTGWRKQVRIVGAGLALVLALGASGEGCDDSSSGSATECPKIEAAGATSPVTKAVAAARLPADDLDDDIARAREIAQKVADATDSPCVRSSDGIGYKVTIAYKKGRTIVVRVMAHSKRRANYYRVAESEKGTVNRDGEYSDEPEDTHIDIDDDPDDTVDDSLDTIDKPTDEIKERDR